MTEAYKRARAKYPHCRDIRFHHADELPWNEDQHDPERHFDTETTMAVKRWCADNDKAMAMVGVQQLKQTIIEKDARIFALECYIQNLEDKVRAALINDSRELEQKLLALINSPPQSLKDAKNE